jgi:malate synthase
VLGDRPNQLDKQRPDVHVTAADLIAAGSTPGTVTLEGVRTNISDAQQYLTAWVS